MAKIVFFSIPAAGHTNPTLGVVRELVRRGHEVWYYCYDAYREKIEAAGAHYISCDAYHPQDAVSAKDGTKVGKDLVFSTKLLVDSTLALDETVCEHMTALKPDCIVYDSMAVWGKAAAKKLDIPYVCSTTTFAFNRFSSKVMKQDIKQLLSMIFGMGKIQKQIRRLQAKGYPVKSMLNLIASDENAHTIVYTSPGFQPCSETFDPEKFAFVGPSIRPAQSEIEKTAPKLIYISMGTVNNDLLPFYKACVAQLGNTAYQVILSLGKHADRSALGEIPANISVFESVDQIAVLEKADVFVSHCGMNSASESLCFGVPLVMHPQTAEQGGVAERVRQLGAGLMLEKGMNIRAAVEAALSDPAYRANAEKIAAGFRACAGAAAAADKILSVCNIDAGC